MVRSAVPRKARGRPAPRAQPRGWVAGRSRGRGGRRRRLCAVAVGEEAGGAVMAAEQVAERVRRAEDQRVARQAKEEEERKAEWLASGGTMPPGMRSVAF